MSEVNKCPRCEEVREYHFLKSNQELYCDKCLASFDPMYQENRLGKVADILLEIDMSGTCRGNIIMPNRLEQVIKHHENLYQSISIELDEQRQEITDYKERTKDKKFVDNKNILCPECLNYEYLYVGERGWFYCAKCDQDILEDDMLTVSRHNPICHRCGKNLTTESWTYARCGEDHRTGIGIWCAVCKQPAEIYDDDIPF